MRKTFLEVVEQSENLDDLLENTLFSTQAEKDDFLKDKTRVAYAFLFNFFGMLGLINATSQSQRTTILNFLKKDKKLQLKTIDDTNHDISLSLKLAREAGFFLNDTIVNNITKFLVKIRSGQISTIDSSIIGEWAAAMPAAFANNIKDPLLKKAFLDFQKDKGQTIDVSSLAIALKKRVNKVSDGGDYQRLAKRFPGLSVYTAPNTTQSTTSTITPTSGVTSTGPVTTSTLSSKAKKQVAVDISPDKEAEEKAKKEAEEIAKKEAEEKAKKEAEEKAKKEAEEKAKAINPADALFLLDAVLISKIKSTTTDSFTFNEKDIISFISLIKMQFRDRLTTIDPDNITPSQHEFFKLLIQFNSTLEVLVLDIKLNTDVIVLLRALDALEEYIKVLNNYCHITKSIKDIFESISYTTRFSNYTLRQNVYFNVTVLLIYRDLLTKELFNRFSRLDNFMNKVAILDKNIDNKDLVDKINNILFKFYTHTNIVDKLNYFGTSSRPPYVLYRYEEADISNYIIKYFISTQADIKEEIENMITVFGIDELADNCGLSFESIQKMKKICAERLSLINNTHVIKIFGRMNYNSIYMPKYDPKQNNGGGFFLKRFHDIFTPGLLQNGLEDKEFKELRRVSYKSVNDLLVVIGVDINELFKRFPDDTYLQRMTYTSQGIVGVKHDELKAYVKKTYTNINSAIGFTKLIKAGTKEDNIAKMSDVLIDILKEDKTFVGYISYNMLDCIPYMHAETSLKWLRYARDNNFNFIGVDIYKSLNKGYKSKYLDAITSLLQDAIGTDVEEYVGDILAELPAHIIQKIRDNLVSGSFLIDEINNSDIKPFDKIDANRLKQILMYNELNMSVLLGPGLGKKKKGENYVQYFARAKQSITGKTILPMPKAVESKMTLPEIKALNSAIVKKDHAGKHGDVYPIINKVFDVNIEYPEFWTFRKEKPSDGTITPAYHGTGGIAACMILRYGFKVIKASDASVVGRMLGDGIYFSNKIDKSLQYVSNGGYSRRTGQKGYILVLDTNLGKEKVDYRVAGTGNDSIRSPEWCVFNVRAQTRILQAYEVTLASRKNMESYLKEEKYNNFKTFLAEANQEDITPKPTACFLFRDGQIPIASNIDNIEYVDFEEALAKNYINYNMIEYTAQGPMIIFRDAKEDILVDERYASHLSGSDLYTYIDYFNRDTQKS